MSDAQPHVATLQKRKLQLESDAELCRKSQYLGLLVEREADIEALTYALRAIEERDQLREALEWLVNIGYGVGKAGYNPEPGEFEAALEVGKRALTAKEGSPDVPKG